MNLPADATLVHTGKVGVRSQNGASKSQIPDQAGRSQLLIYKPKADTKQ